ncbi:hypothetical protein C8R44DRAFT_875597 [Mycena epipterygia]|nr:hypothetical protein C8R44DRAFT_875597 [Mycena epipterygia]
MSKGAKKAVAFKFQPTTGNIMGVVWEQDENTMKDIGGELLPNCMQNAYLLKYLYGMVVSLGAHVWFYARAVGVDGEQRVGMLASGKTLCADVVVGTNPQDGATRPILLQEQDADEVESPKLVSSY